MAPVHRTGGRLDCSLGGNCFRPHGELHVRKISNVADARIDDQTGELKRMYVAANERSHGIGRALLAALESEARKLNLRKLVLETGIRQHKALLLYEKAGYQRRGPFGEYREDPLSALGRGLYVTATLHLVGMAGVAKWLLGRHYVSFFATRYYWAALLELGIKVYQ